MYRRYSTFVVFLAVLLPLIAACDDVKDHPLVSRFQGSQVLEHKVAEFDEFNVALGPIISSDKYVKMQHVEGKVTKFKYDVPKDHSPLEILRSYQNALQRSGFQILFTCTGDQCFSEKFNGGFTGSGIGIWCRNCDGPMRYLAAKLSRPSGDAYVTVDVVKDNYEGGTWLTIVESKPMESGQVSVNAAALANDITQNGHAAVYGIHFDTGKAMIRPESQPVLAELGKLMVSNPNLKLHVIGHTDNEGSLASNMLLSKKRAEAVVAALVSEYHVSGARLQPAGIGPLSPVATNHNEEGRAKNRRVELVEQ